MPIQTISMRIIDTLVFQNEISWTNTVNSSTYGWMDTNLLRTCAAKQW